MRSSTTSSRSRRPRRAAAESAKYGKTDAAPTMELHFAAFALMGVLAAQTRKPDPERVAAFACRQGEVMARVCRQKWFHTTR